MPEPHRQFRLTYGRPQQLLRLVIVAACIVALFVGGCGRGAYARKDDMRSAPEVVAEAEKMILRKAYASAAVQYAIAIEKDPSVGKYYLRRCELLERIDQDKEAYYTYEDALENITQEDPSRLELTHRLALINANRLYDLDRAEELLQEIPGNTIERLDLAAFLYYQSSQFDTAIKLLNKALMKVDDPDMKALMLYHAALIYHKIGDDKNTFGSLYYAINHAEHLGLIRDIEQLWQELN